VKFPKFLKSTSGLAVVVLAIAAVPTFSSVLHAASGSEAVRRLPSPAQAAPAAAGQEQTAVLSGGCFWGVQGVFAHVKGVRQVISGYAGGAASTANYELVSTGATGHAESVKIVFDPRQVSYGEILRIFFSVATDPTQLNHQFPDEGTQYRSEIFYADATQQKAAGDYIAQLNKAKAFAKPIVTRVDPLKGFYPAEGYHQNYLVLHPNEPYIATYDLPKVAALKSLFPDAYRAAPSMVPLTRS
jgi:peptide-methionine (S)-S-oxide reductase